MESTSSLVTCPLAFVTTEGAPDGRLLEFCDCAGACTLDYKESIDRLMSLVDHERTGQQGPRQKAIYDLSRIQALLELLSNPHTTAHTIHIAGTKGKGSTAALCDAALHAAGFRTGFYSSPHLHSFRERIRRDTKPISEAEFGALVEKVWPHQQWVTNNAQLGPVSLFEFMTSMGFQCFSDGKAEFQTIEVGLGGRLDATNVVNPNVCVITSISRDHTAILGDSLSQIATEKAGIIKSGSQVVVAPQSPEALESVESACQRAGVRPIQVGRDLTWQREAVGPDGQRFSVRGRLGQYQLTIPLLGSHQLENAATAVAAPGGVEGAGPYDSAGCHPAWFCWRILALPHGGIVPVSPSGCRRGPQPVLHRGPAGLLARVLELPQAGIDSGLLPR